MSESRSGFVIGRWGFVVVVLAALALLASGDSSRAGEGASADASAKAAPKVGVIEVVVRNVPNEKGAVMIQLAVSKKDYDEGLGLSELARAPIEGDRASWRFENVPYGVYALRIFHDANSNEKLDTNFLGLPKESFGFSNNAKGRFGPAGWEGASFSVDAPVVRQDVQLDKL